jgi:hypothetical protein
MAFPIAARFVHPGDGYEADQKLAAEHLEPGKVYVVAGVDVGRSSSRLFLDIPDGPHFGFNTVMFDPASVFDEDGGRDRQAEQGHAEFTGWAEAQGYAEDFPDWDCRAEAFAAGMQAARDLAAVAEPQPAPEPAAAMAETRKVDEQLTTLHQRIDAVAEGLEKRAEINRPSKVSQICDDIAASLRRAIA